MGCFALSSEPVLFLYTIIFTINYSILPQLVVHKLCLQTLNKTECEKPETYPVTIQKEASTWWFYMLTCSLVPSVLTVLIWGPLTDIIGRRYAMLAVPFINAIRSIIYLINAYILHAHVGFLLFGSFLSCFYGEFQGVVALCYAYMADITQDNLDHRTVRMAFLESSLFFAGVPAGLLAGFLLQQIGYVPVFILTLIVNLIMFLYVFCFLPDKKSLNSVGNISPEKAFISKENFLNCVGKNEKKNFALLNPINHIKKVIMVVTSRENRLIVLPLILAFGVTVCSLLGELIVQTLYLQNKPFNMSPKLLGYYSASQSTVRGIGIIFVTQLSYRLLKLNDYTLILIGLLSLTTCYLLIGLARSVEAVFLVNIVGFAIPTTTSALRSVVTKQVSYENYGAVLSSMEAIEAIAAVAANGISLWTYNLTLNFYSGVVFYGLSGIALSAFVFVILAYCYSRSVDIVEIK
ncbi:proton-coupled folate transporter-like [Hydra vulgaris]|uniref:Proton-coupled folate transporter-like n=1 Tax=Hydra vulgaris TaxID=6087 RepID=A0ABM4C8A8_HYDVU